jgi:uncharacterized protein (TIGR03437 family)
MWLYPQEIRCLRSHYGNHREQTPVARTTSGTFMEPVPVALHPKHLIHPRFWICGLLLVICGAANAQQSRITKPIDNAQRFTLSGHIHPKATAASDRGRVAPSLKLSYVTLTLTTSDAQKADLKNLLAEQQNPSSPNYHRWLTPAEYADRFGVSPQDLSQITQWLQGQGLSIVNVAQARNWIAISGSAAQIETAFATEIHQYVVNGETHFANATNPSVPAAIGAMVLSIRGLDDFRMKARIQKPKFTSGSGNHYLGPADIATIYDVLPAYNAGIDGSGQKLVIAGQSDVPLSDLQNYQNAFGLTGPLPQMILVGPDPGISSGDREESDLDLELSGAVARNATIILVYSNDVMTSVQYAIDQNLAPVISVSYGSCEPETPQSQVLTFQSWAQQGNAEGITWFDASGDDGAADCDDGQNPGLSVDTPASVPEVTGVGGTSFVEGSGTYWSATNGANGGSALSYIPETTWNTSVEDGEPASGGGGLSLYFSKPSWQVAPGVPGNNARNVPDISGNASPDHDGYIVYTDGQDTEQVYGGTSCPTPVMAAIATLLNQYLGTGGQGNINPKLYSLAQSSLYSTIFHDITTGNNIVTAQTRRAVPVGYNAGVGYDNATGLGSVDAWMLLTCWSGACAAGTPPPPVLTPATASLSLVSNVSSVGLQNQAFLTATAIANDGVTTPVGIVTFSAGTTSLGAPTLVGSAGVSTATLVVEGNELPSDSTTITATYDGSSTTAPVTSSVLLSRAVSSSSGGGPEIPSNGLLDGASFLPRFSPGMIMAVFGATLSPSPMAASSLPLPVTMAGVAATVNGVEAPLYYVSPTQLNIQVPWQTALGPATLTINNNGQVAAQSFNVTAASPGIFTDQNRNIVCGCTAVQGQIATLYLAGAGAVTPAIATGSAPATSTSLLDLPAPASTTLTVAGVEAATSFIGIPFGLVGVTQINFQVPSGMTGRQPVVVSVNGVLSAQAYVNITN